ncbi:MAG: sulfatase-like hydrolase/transferase [Gammaproteobacteria bacterium]|nr:sulfatase-like hydrolase/transferase [Gammaproteobacteria bacterium]
MMKKQTTKKSTCSNNPLRLLGYLIALNLLFLVWQVFYVLMANQNAHFLIFSIIFGKHIQVPLNILPADILFCVIQLTLYLILAIFIWLLAYFIGHLFKFSSKNVERLAFSLWVLNVIAILLTNQVYYPASIFYPITHCIISDRIAGILFHVIGFVLFLACIFALLGFLKLTKKSRYFLVFALAISVIFFVVLHFSHRPVQNAPLSKPNVIIVGLDAVRPDFVYHSKFAPNIYHFLKKSVNFKTSITPLARTFPAWVSILTGQYPIHHGVRFNLTDQSALHLKNTLPTILRRYGYQTIFAMDDRRFSNIDEHFGFDSVVGPKEGANDFLLGSINDLPLSNIFLNTRLGEFLFPYNFANRAATSTYKPEAFVQLIHQRLQTLNPRKPLFLCVHFCLTHWPYTWARQPFGAPLSHLKAYQLALQALDQQFTSLMDQLKQKGLLNNAVVIVISDHGEAFGLNGDRMIEKQTFIRGKKSDKTIFKDLTPLTPLDQKTFPLNISVGHGTDILSFTQYHNVLAFRKFGKEKYLPHFVSGMVSLIDIKPTVLNMTIKLSGKNFYDDGVSLLPEIMNIEKKAPDRMIFVETGFTPVAINAQTYSVQDAVYQSIDLYKIDAKTSNIVMKNSVIPHLMRLKQLGIYYKNWFLASYPKNSHQRLFILVNRKTGQWTDDLTTAFACGSRSLRDKLRKLG